MKNLAKLSILLILAMAVSACRDDEKFVVSELTPEYPEYTVEPEATGLVIKFTMDVQGEIGVSTDVDWITLTNLTQTYVSLTFTVNDTGNARTAEIKFYSEKGLLTTVRIVQTSLIPQLMGFYFVNEGQFGKNNADLGYYSFDGGTYTSGWWTSLNPTVRGELGDAANDIVVTDKYILVVLNNSNILEISDRSGKHLREAQIPNCRKVATDGTYAYVTSYADDGYVAKVDLTSGQVVNTCKVGHEPEGLAILGEKLYVLNSCGYHIDYTGLHPETNEISSISIIDLGNFDEESHVNLDVVNAYSPLTLMPDGKSFFINSSGDYNGVAPSSLIFDTQALSVTKTFSFGGTYSCVYDNKLYILETSFSYVTFEWENSNCVYDPANDSLSEFPVDAEEFESYGAPGGLWISPADGTIFIADKGNYTAPGFLYVYSSTGAQLSKQTVGVCPGHLAWDWRMASSGK